MSELPTSPVYLLKRAELAVRGCVESALGEVAVTPSQYFVLFLVKTGTPCSRASSPVPSSIRTIRSYGAWVERTQGRHRLEGRPEGRRGRAQQDGSDRAR